MGPVSDSGGEELEIAPGAALRGSLRVPGDKSISHRALLLAARAEGISTLRGLSTGEDVGWTRAAVEALGAAVRIRGSDLGDDRPVELEVEGGSERLHEAAAPLYVGNSGTTLRLLAGLVAAYPWLTVLYGDSSVGARPMARVVEPLRRMGADIDGRAGATLAPLCIRGGGLTAIQFDMLIASAQVKSAVLLAGLGASGCTVVHERVPTRAHTEELLAACGADITVTRGTIELRESSLEPFTLDVPGDPSQAAYWVVAACIVPGSDVTVEGVYVGRARAGFLDVLRRMGADIEIAMRDGATADIRARYGPLRGTTVGGEEVAGLIDEIPALAAAGAVAEGVTTFRDAQELKVKETDRIATLTSELGRLGARVEARVDGLTVAGGGKLLGGVVDSHGDHRIAMAMAVAGLAARGPTSVRGWDAVATSYPGFAEDLRRLRA